MGVIYLSNFCNTPLIPSSMVKQLGPSLADGIDKMSQNTGIQLPTNSVKQPRRAITSTKHGRSPKSHRVWYKIWGSHSMGAQDWDHMECYAVSLGKHFQTFLKNWELIIDTTSHSVQFVHTSIQISWRDLNTKIHACVGILFCIWT
jgi:uncharacterized protein Usg